MTIEYDLKSMALLSLILWSMKYFTIVPWWIVFFPIYAPYVILMIMASLVIIVKTLGR